MGGAAILDELSWRGLIAQTTDVDALRGLLDSSQVSLYCGFDPTAPSLHIGNLAQILPLRRFQLFGHRPVPLVGGATGLIGDPSGRETERSLNDADVVAGWVERLRGQLEPFFDFSGPSAAVLANNLDWTRDLPVLDFLRDIGKHFPVNRMFGKESVSTRMESGISYTEFSYMLLQSLDYLELYRRHGVRLQTGGTDQWGNITAGVDLIRRVEGVPVHALTTPLITKADGTKFGKTESGSVWLDPSMTSPYAFYQFWINTSDADAGPYLRTFTFLTREEIESLEQSARDRPALREAQRRLAFEVTALVHGAEEATSAEEASRAIFGSGDLGLLPESILAAAAAELPVARMPAPLPSVVDLLVATGLAGSRSEARRTVTEGGAYLNNARVSDPDSSPSDSALLHGRWLIVRRGRRSVAAVERV